MAYEATSDLLESQFRHFEIEDSLGSRNVVRRQLTVSATSEVPLADLREGDWVTPNPAVPYEYVSVPSGGAAAGAPCYAVISLSGSSPDVLESGGVTGAQGLYTGRTSSYDIAGTYVPGTPLYVDVVDVGDGAVAGAAPWLPGRAALTSVAAGPVVGRVEHFDAAAGVLTFTTTAA